MYFFKLFFLYREREKIKLTLSLFVTVATVIKSVTDNVLSRFVGTCTLILGRHLGFLKPNSTSTITTRLAEAVRIHFTASRDAFYGLPLWKLLPTSAYRQLIESEDTIYKYVTCTCNRFPSAVTPNDQFSHN